MSARFPALWTMLFSLVVPFPVTLVIPWAITGWRFDEPFLGWPMTRGMGAAAALAGLPLLAESLWRFARVGRGTPSPLMPTERLVTSGAYRFVRNPMYVGAVLVVLGQAVMFGSRAVFLYGAALAVAFHLFVTLYEEPALRTRYGAEYARYCEHVPRWILRVTAGCHHQTSQD